MSDSMATEIMPLKSDNNSMIITDDDLKDDSFTLQKTETFFDVEPPKTKCYEIASLSDILTYIKEHPKQAFTIILYIAGFIGYIVLIGIYYFNEKAGTSKSDDIYYIAGTSGFILCLYGSCNFSTLIRLKAEIDSYASKNIQFRNLNYSVKKKVDRLKRGNKALKRTRDKLAESINIYGEQLIKFDELTKNLNSLNINTKTELKSLNKVSSNMKNRMKDQLIVKQRKILLKCLENNTDLTDKGFVDETEYQSFKASLPPIYQRKLDNVGTFESLAGDDLKLDVSEFGNALDRLARQSMSKKSYINLNLDQNIYD